MIIVFFILVILIWGAFMLFVLLLGVLSALIEGFGAKKNPVAGRNFRGNRESLRD
jgi:hypothetical protein